MCDSVFDPDAEGLDEDVNGRVSSASACAPNLLISTGVDEGGGDWTLPASAFGISVGSLEGSLATMDAILRENEENRHRLGKPNWANGKMVTLVRSGSADSMPSPRSRE